MILSGLRSLWLAESAAVQGGGATAGGTAPDAIILDLAGCGERGPGALAGLLDTARRRSASGRVLVRVSPLATQDFTAEMATVLPSRPDGVLLPDCVDGRDVQHGAVKLAVLEAEHGWDAGSTAIVAAPAAAGLLALSSFRGSSSRLQAFALEGPAVVDETSSVAGAEEPLLGPVARALILLAARSAGVPAFDATPWPASDGDMARHRARREGFGGCITRNVSEIAAINDAFGPGAARS